MLKAISTSRLGISLLIPSLLLTTILFAMAQEDNSTVSIVSNALDVANIVNTNQTAPPASKSTQPYFPSPMYVDVGETVIWENEDTVSHTVTSGDPSSGPTGIFDSGEINPGENFGLKFNQEGTFINLTP